jgi:hypothetical protein
MKKIRPIRMATHGKAWKDLIKVHRRVLVVEVLNLFSSSVTMRHNMSRYFSLTNLSRPFG